MAHPATRILAVLELLQAHGRMSGKELARRLEVDTRTLRRYITVLEEIGIPVTAERGRHGAYMLVAGFKLPPLMFTEDETLAISLGLLAARGLGLAEAASAVASAQAKLERVMPAGLRHRVRAVNETTSLDLGTAVRGNDNAVLAHLTAAAQERRRTHIRYRSATGEPTVRGFDPYGLVYREARWYVVGMCHLRKGLRSFRVDRIQNVQSSDIPFERPPDFDAMKHLTFSIATIPRTFAVEILLHAELDTVLAELPESLGLFEPRSDDVLLHARTDSINWFARLLSRLPFDYEILAPAELRAAMHIHAKRLLQLVGKA